MRIESSIGFLFNAFPVNDSIISDLPVYRLRVRNNVILRFNYACRHGELNGGKREINAFTILTDIATEKDSRDRKGDLCISSPRRGR